MDSDVSSDSIKVMKTASGFIEIPQKAIEEFNLILGKSNVLTDPETVEKLSKDFYWFSPKLKRELDDKRADVVLKIDLPSNVHLRSSPFYLLFSFSPLYGFNLALVDFYLSTTSNHKRREWRYKAS